MNIGDIHALCLIKNEADVLEPALRAALTWCDHIYVFDNGSTDGSWEIVQTLARQHPAIVPYRHEDVPFRDGLRSAIFNRFRDQAKIGDWWCLLPADEFYVDDPRVFLTKVRPPYGIVWDASISYYFSSEDAARYRRDPALYSDAIPVQERIRYYLSHWSEIRFFRHDPALHWPDHSRDLPPNLETLFRHYPVRILLRHYAYRSPKQLETRLATRAKAMKHGAFVHEAWKGWSAMVNPAALDQTRSADFAAALYSPDAVPTNWESRIVPAEHLDYDCGDRRFVIREDLMPSIPGTKPKTWRNSRLLNNRLVAPLKIPVKAVLRGLRPALNRSFQRC